MAKNFKPAVVTSLHGFKSHGKWQTSLSDFLSTKSIKCYSFNYGYQFWSCLIPGFKRRMIKKFYEEYVQLTKNKEYKIDLTDPRKRPSIVAHSLGSYILCHAMLKYPDIKFDKILLCGAIVNRKFDWEKLVKRNQVFFIRNEHSKKDSVVKWGWILAKKDAGKSGSAGFTNQSDSLDQEEFEQFEHSSFFEGLHMESYWLPFFNSTPPIFEVIPGSKIRTIDEYNYYLRQTEIIDNLSYGNEQNWANYAIPIELGASWLKVNNDIYSFLLKDPVKGAVIGYINAMPIKNNTFEKLLRGEIHDNDILASDIIPFNNGQKNLDLYVMSIAINPNYQSTHLGLKDVGMRKLFDSLFDKLKNYFLLYGVKVKRIAAMGWTDAGIRLCESFGMQETGHSENTTNKPIFCITVNEKKPEIYKHGPLRNLIQLYAQRR